MNSKAIKRQLLAAIAMVLVAAVALGSSTYAWFVNNTQVTATNVSVTATTAYSLLIKHGTTGSYGTTTALNSSVVLKPVSTVGALASDAKTLTAKTESANAVGIGDGTTVAKNDMVFFASDTWNASAQVATFKEVSKESKHTYLTGEGENNTAQSKYFYTDTVYLKAGQASKIYLDNTSTGIYDSSSGNLTKFSNVADGASKNLLETMRVAFVVTQNNSSRVYFYQLNSTSSGTGFNYNTTIADANGIIQATASESTVGNLDSVNNYSSGVVALTDAVMATGKETGFATAPTTDADKNTLATVAADEQIQVDIYMWMEGCDWDTTAANSAQFNTTIEGIQFGFCVGEPPTQSGG